MLITRPTLRRLSRILVIGDLTERMVLGWVIENIVLSVVNRCVVTVPSHVVRNHIDHKILGLISACRSCRARDRSTYHAPLV